MKKIVKKLLILIVAICSTFGILTFAGNLPWWFGFGGGVIVPNANVNALFNNGLGNLNPFGIGQQQNLTVTLTNTGIFPAKPTKFAPVKLTFKNAGTEERWVTWLTNSGSANPAQALIQPGGTFVASPTLTTPGAYDFEISAPNQNSSSFIWTIKILAQPGAGGAGIGGGATLTGNPAAGAGNNPVPAAAFNQNVLIKDGAVDPVMVNIPQTGKVTWKNGTTEAKMIIDPNGVFSTAVPIAPGATFTSPAFANVGIFKYTVKNANNANNIFAGGVNVFALPAAGAGGAGGGATTTPAGGAIPNGVTPVQSATVKITTTALDPATVHLTVGGKVTWENTTNQAVKLGATGAFSGLFANLIPAGGSYTFVFTHPVQGITYEATGGLMGKVNVY